LLDSNVPEVDGFDVLQTLRQDPLTTFLPLAMVTARELTEADRWGARERAVVKHSIPVARLGVGAREPHPTHPG
jgi:CheY-like chemotaxis protein